MRRTQFINYLSKAYIFILIFVLFYFVIANRKQINNTFLQADFLFLGISAFIFHIYFCASALAWAHLTTSITQVGERPRSVDWIRIFVASHFGRYLPTKVGLALGRIAFMNTYGFPISPVVASILLEQFFVLYSASIVSILIFTVIGVPGIFSGNIFLAPPVLIFSLFIFYLVVLFFTQKIDRIADRLGGSASHFDMAPLSKFSYIFMIEYSLIASLSGLGFFFFCTAFGVMEITPYNLAYCTGAVSIAGILGALAIFAPGGIGVREATLAFALSPIMDVSEAGVLAISFRLYLTLIEVLLFSVSGSFMLLIQKDPTKA